MPFWTLFGLRKGKATTPWPQQDDATGQEGVLGMPRFDPERCEPAVRNARRSARPRRSPLTAEQSGEHGSTSITAAASPASSASRPVRTGASTPRSTGRSACASRSDLVLSGDRRAPPGKRDAAPSRAGFRRSLHIRHVDAGSCNGCESELQALNNPFYNLHRLGIFFTPVAALRRSAAGDRPRHLCDARAAAARLRGDAEPRWVMAAGTCAVSGGVAGGGYACGNGLDGVLPVDLYLPGCPPNPAAMIEALLMFLDRVPQRVRGRPPCRMSFSPSASPPG